MKVSQVHGALEGGNPVNTRLATENSILVIEKLLPYLCVYRYKTNPDPQFVQIVKTQASYIICQEQEAVDDILLDISQVITNRFGTIMILELWPAHANSRTFKLFCSELPGTTKAFRTGLDAFSSEEATKFEVVSNKQGHPSNMGPLFSDSQLKDQIIYWAGLEIPPLYRGKAGTTYPIYFRGFKSFLSETIQKAMFAFIRVQTPNQFSHHTMLGKTKIDEAAKEADSCLSDVSDRMKFLLAITPINQDTAWEVFKKEGFKEPPKLKYRMISLDPEKEKKALYNIPMGNIEDPALSFIMRDKRSELSKQLSMLEERGTDNFRYLGQSIYGVPEKYLVKAARKILKEVKRTNSERQIIDCFKFKRQVTGAFSYYRNQFKDQEITVGIYEKTSGLIVSQRHLMISKTFKASPTRAKALIEHEVGTHILTYCNGFRQPIRLMASGFAGYDELQEGIGVLSEYLAGAFNPNRLRMLASRVIGVDAMVNGCDFVQAFNLLRNECELDGNNAFKVAVRVFRGGGLTKDAVYLKGLIRLLDFLKEGGNLETLYTGKFNFKHIPLVEELLYRNVIKPPVLPRCHHEKETLQRLGALHQINSVEELLN